MSKLNKEAILCELVFDCSNEQLDDVIASESKLQDYKNAMDYFLEQELAESIELVRELRSGLLKLHIALMENRTIQCKSVVHENIVEQIAKADAFLSDHK